MNPRLLLASILAATIFLGLLILWAVFPLREPKEHPTVARG